MKTPEFNVSDMYENGYCGCPLCTEHDQPVVSGKYEIICTGFNGAVIFFKTKQYKDNRGFFQECWNQQTFNDEIAANVTFVQDNMSSSVKNVFRGMHFQWPNHPQAKLVNCISGHLIDFVMDIRPDSMYFGKTLGFELNDPSLFLYIPENFAHGFYTLEQSTFSYKVSDYRYAEEEHGVMLQDITSYHDYIQYVNQNNESFSFSCRMLANAIMSKKDKANHSLTEFCQIQKEISNEQ